MSDSKRFADMTEEERVEWAKGYKWKTAKVTNPGSLARNKRAKARDKVKDNIRRRRDYYNPEKRKKQWGEEYNARLRYLYNHNEEFRQLKLYRKYFRDFRLRKKAYQAWVHRYYQEYRGNMDSYASYFKLEGSELYMKGFTLSDLVKYAPTGGALIKSFMKDGIFPEPKYVGYKFKDKKMNDFTEPFYLVSEIEHFLNVFALYKKRYNRVTTEDQKLYLKKNLWLGMLKAREEFDNA